jgi:hypothetical protein
MSKLILPQARRSGGGLSDPRSTGAPSRARPADILALRGTFKSQS